MAPEDVAKIVPLDEPLLGAAELDAIVAIAYLAMTADGFAGGAELAALRAMIARLRALATRAVKQSEYRTMAGAAEPRPLEDDEMAEMLERAAATTAERDPVELMNELAAKLSPPARVLAYKVAYAIVMVDIADTRAEHDMLDELSGALEMNAETVDLIVDEVLARLSA